MEQNGSPTQPPRVSGVVTSPAIGRYGRQRLTRPHKEGLECGSYLASGLKLKTSIGGGSRGRDPSGCVLPAQPAFTGCVANGLVAKFDPGAGLLIRYVRTMTDLPKKERIAHGKVRIAFTMPERLIGELDVEVAKQKMAGNWIRRNAGLEIALRRFFDDGGLVGLGLVKSSSAFAGRRRHMTTHLDRDVVVEMKRQIVEQDAGRTFWSPWEVLAIAVQHFLKTGAFGPEDQP